MFLSSTHERTIQRHVASVIFSRSPFAMAAAIPRSVREERWDIRGDRTLAGSEIGELSAKACRMVGWDGTRAESHGKAPGLCPYDPLWMVPASGYVLVAISMVPLGQRAGDVRA